MTQHVEESGHWNWLPGHWTAPRELLPDARKQARPSALQWKPRGQQWRPSAQDTASGKGQQLEVPETVRTQEAPWVQWASPWQGLPRRLLSVGGHLSRTRLQQL